MLVLGLALALALDGFLVAAEIDSVDKYAWSENSGWLNFNSHYGTTQVFEDHLEGYAWAENIGWIRLGSHTGGGAYHYSNTSVGDWGVNQAVTGKLSGYAWSENAGWINFGAANTQLTLSTDTGALEGYAWGENIGWIHFNQSVPAYKVRIVLGPYVVSTAAPAEAGSFTPEWLNIGHNDTASFSITATPGYTIDSVTGCGGSWSGQNPYVTAPVTADCTVTATFSSQNEQGECSFIVLPGRNNRLAVICL